MFAAKEAFKARVETGELASSVGPEQVFKTNSLAFFGAPGSFQIEDW